MKILTPLALLFISFTHQASANIDIKFVESAPKDWFSITNTGTCNLPAVTMHLDLTPSAGRLIFDTEAKGAGVEVYQPFEVRQGEIKLLTGEGVKDGEDKLSVQIVQLAPGEVASFTIDVDDTLTNSELGMIRVSKAEIAGAEVSVESKSVALVKASFDETGQVKLPFTDCQG